MGDKKGNKGKRRMTDLSGSRETAGHAHADHKRIRRLEAVETSLLAQIAIVLSCFAVAFSMNGLFE